MSRRLPSVVLIGRPNVGKSTLFNRVTGTRRAIVTPIPGTTRDVLALPAEWRGVPFELTDTGGMFGASQDPLHALVLERGHRAIAAADVIVFVVDGREGLVAGDEEIAHAARAANKPVIVAINKTDDRRGRGSMDFFQLGFDPVVEVSAEHGEGTGDLLDAVVETLRHAGLVNAGGAGSEVSHSPERPDIAVAIVGRPNAGKSSLVNRLLREERMIVSEMPGTTRDAVDSTLTWHQRAFRIVDTAGIRRPGRVSRGGAVEEISVLLARRAIESADIVVLVIDATAGATDQDAAIAGEADRAGRGVVVVANKWDLTKGQGAEYVKEFDERLRRQLKFLDYAPILHISALTGERTPKLLQTIDRVAAARSARVRTPELNRFVERVTAAHPPASPGRTHVRILYAAQTGVAPPTFVFFTNVATTFHFSYERFLMNQLRETFGFEGTPIRFHVRTRTRRPRAKPGDRPSRADAVGEAGDRAAPARKDRNGRRGSRYTGRP